MKIERTSLFVLIQFFVLFVSLDIRFEWNADCLDSHTFTSIHNITKSESRLDVYLAANIVFKRFEKWSVTSSSYFSNESALVTASTLRYDKSREFIFFVFRTHARNRALLLFVLVQLACERFHSRDASESEEEQKNQNRNMQNRTERVSCERRARTFYTIYSIFVPSLSPFRSQTFASSTSECKWHIQIYLWFFLCF